MDTATLEQLCEAAASLYDRGYAFGSTGNLSLRDGEHVWITPTGGALKRLRPHDLACVDLDGEPLNQNRASKELPFHLAVYRARSEARAVVHLHSTYAVALSCLEVLDAEQPLPPLTPYYFMRVAPLAVLPYFRPGSPALAEAVEQAASGHHCMLLRHHGTVCAGASLNEALDRAEELEATARLFFVLRNERTRLLSTDEIDELRRAFANP
ncbi:MAG TPA: aldolase [Blastocatellia bacterium]|nr:aldolase [Blastocatellia bacterium]